MNTPSRIVCLTEEPAEVLYLLGEEARIVGVSAFAVRPAAVAQKKRVCAFTSANIEKIKALKPDLVIGYSDIQKDIARDLIEAGLNVWISNHRSLTETLDYIEMLARLVGRGDAGLELCAGFRKKMDQAREHGSKRPHKPRVYLEEWHDPMISGIRYFSELVELCGGHDIFRDLSHGFKASERFVTSEEVIAGDPEVIFASWCGKKVEHEHFYGRPGWSEIRALREKRIIELDSSIILQPGPALFVDGIDLISRYLDAI